MTMIAPAPSGTSRTPGMRTTGLLGTLLGDLGDLGDLGGPIAVYYAAKAAGTSTGLALALGGVVCLPRQLAELVRRRRLDGLGIAVLLSFALGGGLSLLSGDAHFLVLKDAIWPLAAGIIVGASCLRGKPVTFFMFRPVLTAGRIENRPFWDELWAADAGAPFRSCLRILAAAWTVILLAAGAAELALGCTLSLNEVAGVSLMVHLVMLLFLLGVTALYAKNTGLGVRRSLEAGNSEVGAR